MFIKKLSIKTLPVIGLFSLLSYLGLTGLLAKEIQRPNPNEFIITPQLSTIHQYQQNYLDNKARQILHFNSLDKNEEFMDDKSKKFIEENFQENGMIFESDVDILRYALAEAKNVKGGLYLHFGIKNGRSLNLEALLNPDETIYAFDRLTGLPCKWREGFDKGTFAFKDPSKVLTQATPPNVVAYGGEFAETLKEFFSSRNESKISFIAMDVEVYESAKEVLTALTHYIRDRTILYLDEAINYVDIDASGCWWNHEMKALWEWCHESGFNTRYRAYNRCHEQVVVQLEAKESIK